MICRQSWLATTIQKPSNCNPSKRHLHLKIHQMRNVLQSPSGTQMNWDTEVIGELSERMYIQNYSSILLLYDFSSFIAVQALWLQLKCIFTKHHTFFKHNFCVKSYVPRELRRDPSYRRLNEHGIYIRHCQESNSQPVPSQAGADTTRP